MNLYGVKAVFSHTVNDEKRYYEEMILSVKASSFDEAYEKAENYADQNCNEYLNPNGQRVKTSGYELLDCFLAFDEEDDVTEVYSSHTTNKSTMPEKEYYELITHQCSTEELGDLRNKRFN